MIAGVSVLRTGGTGTTSLGGGGGKSGENGSGAPGKGGASNGFTVSSGGGGGVNGVVVPENGSIPAGSCGEGVGDLVNASPDHATIIHDTTRVTPPKGVTCTSHFGPPNAHV